MRDFNRLLAVGGLCAAMALLGLTGCAWHSDNQVARETGRTPQQVKTDKSISEQVAKGLASAPIYKYPDVKVDAYKGDVSLSGFVLNDGQKNDATKIAQEYAIGHKVYNNLVVQPTPTGPLGQSIQGQPPQNQQPNPGQPNQAGSQQ